MCWNSCSPGTKYLIFCVYSAEIVPGGLENVPSAGSYDRPVDNKAIFAFFRRGLAKID